MGESDIRVLCSSLIQTTSSLRTTRDYLGEVFTYAKQYFCQNSWLLFNRSVVVIIIVIIIVVIIIHYHRNRQHFIV